MAAPNRLTIRQISEMAELYKAGFSQSWIARRFGVAQSTVQYHLRRRLNHKQRRKPGSGQPEWISPRERERTALLYTHGGLGLDEIGLALDLNRSTVHERLRRAGVEMRSKREAARFRQKLSLK